jgi:predicted anti-sigma-YlaC factor YlaD
MTRFARRLLTAASAAAALAAPACSMKQRAMRTLADAIASSNASSMASDDDPELIRDAAPFSLKLIEMLLDKQPKHAGLLLAAARGFTQYSYAFVQFEADRIEQRNPAAAGELRRRAEKLFLRARDYGLRGLAVRHPDFAERLKSDPARAARQLTAADVPFMYWTAAAWAGAASNDLLLLPQIPEFEALVLRALELNETYGEGALHTFMIGYEMTSPTRTGDKALRAKRHFERAIELSGGRRAAPYVAYAERVLTAEKDRAAFEDMLKKALAVDVDAEPESRLENVVFQRRARWLLGRVDQLFPDARKSN